MRRTTTALLVAALAGPGLAAAVERPHHLEEAIRAQERLAAARPDDSRVLNDMGNLLALAGHTERAEESYRRALEIAPDEATLHYNLGLLLRQIGRNKAALREMKRVVKLDSSDAWGHYQLGTLLEEKGERADAIHHFSRAFLLEPELAELELNPQLLDSRLMTHALTIAYVERVAMLEAAPRQYQQPRRITRLLVPETRGGPDPAKPTTEGVEPGPRPKKKKKRDKGSSG